MIAQEHDPMPPPSDQSILLLQAIGALETKLVTLINASHAGLSANIAEVKQQHSDALIAQERRNSTFADRSHTDSLQRIADRNADELLRLREKVDKTESALTDLSTTLAELKSQAQANVIAFLKSGYGIAFGLLTAAMCGVGVTALQHVWK